jgi:hypothetical protein
MTDEIEPRERTVTGPQPAVEPPRLFGMTTASIIAVLALLGSISVAWGILLNKTNTLEVNAVEDRKEVRTLDTSVTKLKTDYTEVRTDVKWMRRTMDDINKKMDRLVRRSDRNNR